MRADSPLLVLVGTKAQFIKTAPILNELDRRQLPYHLVYTGQHSETFDDLEVAFATRAADDLLVPDFEADSGMRFATWTARFVIQAVQRLLSGAWSSARMALVHGDTASTLFGAILARLAGVPVAHVEAGLRSQRLLEPFPEELIRRAVSRITGLHFVPDQVAAGHLGADKGQVVDTGGNTLRDALGMVLGARGGVPAQGGEGGYGVVSMHRNENLSDDATFDMIMAAVIEASGRLPLRFVLHPVTRKRIASSRWQSEFERNPGITLLPRVGYPDFIEQLIGARLLMTDGGSNQEEAAMLGMPTLLLRRTTERLDGLGECVELSELKPEAIRNFVERFWNRGWTPRFDDLGSPSKHIVDTLESVGVWSKVSSR